ncbi:MAG: PAS domain S-box protein [Pyrinomonadaceae bacterium]
MTPQDAIGQPIPADPAREGSLTQQPTPAGVDAPCPPIEFYEAVLANIGEGVYTCDAQGSITSVNPAAEKLLGWSFDELKGRSMHDVAHHSHRDGNSFPAEECIGFGLLLDGKSLTDHEDFFIRRDGTYFDVTYSASAIRDADGIIGWVVVFRDVTEHKRTVDALRESEERFSKAFNASHLALSISSLVTGKLIEVNDTFVEVTGYSRDEAIGRTTVDLGLWAASADREAEMEMVRRAGSVRNLEYRFKVRSGEEIVGLLSAELIVIGNEPYTLTVIQNVTESRNADRALKQLLQQTEQQSLIFNTTLSSITDFAYIFDLDGRFSYSNKALTDLLGITAEEIIGKNFFDLNYPPELAKRLQDQIQSVIDTKTVVRDETPYTGANGQEGYYEYIFTPVIAPDGSVQNVAGSTRDVTEWRKRDKELQDAHDELEMRVASRTKDLADSNSLLLRQMEARALVETERSRVLKRLFTIQEDERGRIARNIHDQLGQRLTAMRLKIASLKDTCADDPTLTEHIAHLEEIAGHLDSEVSFLAWEMRPPILDQTNFAEALEHYIEEWSRYSEIGAEFKASGTDEMKLDDEVETNLYRITQEALNNAAKHAEATQINVLLNKNDDSLTLIIEDNGVGFDINAASIDRAAGGGFGLVGMRDRSSLISGTLEIESAKGKGTTIFVRVPVAAE